MLKELRQRITRADSRRRLLSFYPDEGPLRRELYPRHLQFFRGGKDHRERLMMAANRIGKTEGIGGYETALHLTGQYPPWWEGRRFNHGIRAWASGKTNSTTRDIIQAKLCGPVEYQGGRKAVAGTGLIPGDSIGDIAWKAGIPDLIDYVQVRHVCGDVSTLGLKSYEQGRGSFEGTEQDLIWLDEEPSLAVYVECLVRTMTTDGMVMVTFTPLEGMSEVVMSFLENGKLPDQEAA